MLRSLAGLEEEVAWHGERQLPPLPLWTSVRLFQLLDSRAMMDTLGMEQLESTTTKLASRFETGRYAPRDVDAFLRGATDYVRRNGPVIEDGNSLDGPGGIHCTATTIEESLAPRPRRMLRWLPQDGTTPPL